MDIYRSVANLLQENTWVASGAPGRCIVVDPGFSNPEEQARLEGILDSEGLRPEAIFLTHGHMDHCYGAAHLQRRFNVPIYMSDDDWPTLRYFERISKFGIQVADTSFSTTPVRDGATISAAGLILQVITTPGHSPGSVCYYEKAAGVLFTGDTLFAGTIGRTDLFRGDYDLIIVSVMEKLSVLPADTRILPGHGSGSTIGSEMTTNPFLEPFNEREEMPELKDND